MSASVDKDHCATNDVWSELDVQKKKKKPLHTAGKTNYDPSPRGPRQKLCQMKNRVFLFPVRDALMVIDK